MTVHLIAIFHFPFKQANKQSSNKAQITNSNLTKLHKKHLTFNYMYTKINIKNIYTNLKIVHLVLPLCTIPIKLGHAGIVDLSV